MESLSANRFLWLAVLVAVYSLIWIYYGGNGAPLTVSEGKVMLDAIQAMYSSDSGGGVSSDTFAEFRSNIEPVIALDDGKEFFMVNLETREQGALARQAEEAYGAVVLPLLLKRGSFPVYVGDRIGCALGHFGQTVDRVAIIRYRSLRDFLDMNADPLMIKAVANFKFASLKHTEVFFTRPTISFFTVRFTLALLLFVVGWAGCKLSDRISDRGRKNVS